MLRQKITLTLTIRLKQNLNVKEIDEFNEHHQQSKKEEEDATSQKQSECKLWTYHNVLIASENFTIFHCIKIIPNFFIQFTQLKIKPFG
jgi:hypothetical protein